MQNGRTRILLAALAVVSACSGEAISPDKQSSVTAQSGFPGLSTHPSAAIAISTVDALYTAINDPANAGMHIQVASGTYVLDGTRPNGGRLELQKDMTLSGVSGQRGNVVLDASGLSVASLTDAGLVTGAIRMGRGHNTVAWLTIRRTLNGAAAITTDLLLPGPTTINISHVAANGGVRGFDIRNVGAGAAGRVLDVFLTDNDLADNTLGNSQGIRIANFSGAKGARIRARLSGNASHGHIAGLLAANVGADSAIVDIESNGDHFSHNGNGAIILGGNAAGSGVIRGALVRFSAIKSAFEHNTGSLPAIFPTRAGIAPYGGVSTVSNRAFDNRVDLTLTDVTLGDNGGPDVRAWGAISTAAAPAGTANVVSITLQGTSKNASVDTISSDPPEPSGTNKVVVHR